MIADPSPCVACGHPTRGQVLDYDGPGTGWFHLCRDSAACERRRALAAIPSEAGGAVTGLTVEANAVPTHWDVRTAAGDLVAVIHNPGARYWWVHWMRAAPADLCGTRAPRCQSKRAALAMIGDVLAGEEVTA